MIPSDRIVIKYIAIAHASRTMQQTSKSYIPAKYCLKEHTYTYNEEVIINCSEEYPFSYLHLHQSQTYS